MDATNPRGEEMLERVAQDYLRNAHLHQVSAALQQEAPAYGRVLRAFHAAAQEQPDLDRMTWVLRQPEEVQQGLLASFLLGEQVAVAQSAYAASNGNGTPLRDEGIARVTILADRFSVERKLPGISVFPTLTAGQVVDGHIESFTTTPAKRGVLRIKQPLGWMSLSHLVDKEGQPRVALAVI